MTAPLQQHHNNAQRQALSPWKFLPPYLTIVISVLVFLVAFVSLRIFFQSISVGIWLIVPFAIVLLFSSAYIIFQLLFLNQLRQAVSLNVFNRPHILENTSTSNKINYRTILANPLSVDPETIVQCEKTVKKIFVHLLQPDTSTIVITGIAGVGKSTLASLIYHYAEKLRRSSKKSFTAEALWLHVSDSTTLVDLAVTIFTALGKPLPDLSKLAPSNQAVALFNAITSAENARLIVLDQFDNLLDGQTGYSLFSSPGVGEWLDAINSQPSSCRLLLTSRVWPHGIRTHSPICMREYFCTGLEGDEGVDLLQKQGLNAPDTLLRAVVENCGGHALALKLLASLSQKRNLSLDKILHEPKGVQVWAENVAHNLLDNIYLRQLDQLQRLLLLAFSAYREAVPLDAVHFAIISIIPSISRSQVQKSIDTLLVQHILKASEEGRYQPHAIIANYIQNHLVKSDEQRTWQLVHASAAQYYVQWVAKNGPSREKRRKISDVSPLIEAVWQRCQAELYREAYDLMKQEQLFVDLKRWGGNAMLLELYHWLLPLEKWHPKRLEIIQICISLGRVYRTLGDRGLAVEYLEKALSQCREVGNSWEEGRALAFLGRTLADLGQKEQAIKCYVEALKIRREGGNREGEGWTLDDLSLVYDDLGQFMQALQYGEQALEIRREIGDRRGEGRTLNTLGRVYDSLEERDRALEAYNEALKILKEVGDRGGEAAALNNLGLLYSRLGQKWRVWEYYQKALHIFGEIEDRAGVCMTQYNLGLTYYDIGQYEEAKRFLESALGIRRQIRDRWGESIVLNDLGKVYDDLGQKEQALKCYEEALRISRELKDRRGEGLTLARLGVIDSSLGKKKAARGHFEQALNLFREVGDRWGEGKALNDLGIVNSILGKKPQASRYLDEALSVFKEIGYHEGIGGTLNDLGLVYGELGKFEEAQKNLKQALNLFEVRGDQRGKGRALNNLGTVYSNIGYNEEAQKYYEQSLQIQKAVGDRNGEATTLNNLGRIFIMLGQYEDALRYLEESLSIFRDLGDQWGEGRALSNLGRFYDILDEKERALKHFDKSLSILREVGDRREQARVLNSLAMLYADQHPEMALESLENALQINREVRDPKGEGWTLNNLGRIYLLLEQKERAQVYFKQALHLRKKVGDRKGEGWTLHNIGMLYFEQSCYDIALACFSLAEVLFNELESSDHDKPKSYIEKLKQKVGVKQFADLLAEVKLQAHEIIKRELGEEV